MHSASPPYQCPSTPLAPRNPLAYKPLNSSPLNACSSDWYNSSPVAAAQAHRRRSQYKTLTPNTPTRVFSNSRRSSGRLFTDGGYIATPSRPDSQKLSLRNRFKARCFERAAKARERAIKGKRYTNQPSSDDFTMDYDDEDEDDDEDIMQDEVCVFFSTLLLQSVGWNFSFLSRFFEELWPMPLGKNTTPTEYLMLKKSDLLLTRIWRTSLAGNKNWQVY